MTDAWRSATAFKALASGALCLVLLGGNCGRRDIDQPVHRVLLDAWVVQDDARTRTARYLQTVDELVAAGLEVPGGVDVAMVWVEDDVYCLTASNDEFPLFHALADQHRAIPGPCPPAPS